MSITVFTPVTSVDNIDGLNKYKQQTTNNLQLYSCARSQHAHAIRGELVKYHYNVHKTDDSNLNQ